MSLGAGDYRPRDAEHTVLYRVIDEHLEAFLENGEASRRRRPAAGLSSASIQGRIALGPRAGARVWRVGADPDAPWVLSTAPRHAHLAGFDLHAHVDAPGGRSRALGTALPLSAPARGGAGSAAAAR